MIRRWIAEGFVNEKEGLSVEDIAEAFFNQLIERMIIRPVENSSDRRIFYNLAFFLKFLTNKLQAERIQKIDP